MKPWLDLKYCVCINLSSSCECPILPCTIPSHAILSHAILCCPIPSLPRLNKTEYCIDLSLCICWSVCWSSGKRQHTWKRRKCHCCPMFWFYCISCWNKVNQIKNATILDIPPISCSEKSHMWLTCDTMDWGKWLGCLDVHLSHPVQSCLVPSCLPYCQSLTIISQWICAVNGSHSFVEQFPTSISQTYVTLLPYWNCGLT